MDVLEFLSNEHDEAKAVFKKLEKAEGAEADRLFQQLHTMLSLHEELEEKLLYPQLKEEKQTQDIVLESYQEHHVMDVLLKEISKLKPDAEEWEPKIKVLQENTEHHIEEEEGDLFPKVRKLWNAEKRKEVGSRMEDLKATRQKGQRAA